MTNTAVQVLTGPLCKLWEHRFSVPGLASIPPWPSPSANTWRTVGAFPASLRYNREKNCPQCLAMFTNCAVNVNLMNSNVNVIANCKQWFIMEGNKHLFKHCIVFAKWFPNTRVWISRYVCLDFQTRLISSVLYWGIKGHPCDQNGACEAIG